MRSGWLLDMYRKLVPEKTMTKMGNIKATLEELLARANSNVKVHRKQVESKLQCACVRWFRYQYPKLSHALFSVPNGAYFAAKGKMEGARMKAEGLLPGVSDMILLQHSGIYGALLIEFKTKQGRQNDAQKQWQKKVEKDGYKYVIVRSLEEFQNAVNSYLEKR